MTKPSPQDRRGEPPAIQIRPSNELPETFMRQKLPWKLGSANRTVVTPTDGSWDSTQLISNANNIAGAQGAYAATTNDLQTHAAALQALRDHLATATTPKDVQDTQAQIALEQAWTANEAAQMAAVKASFDSQKDNAEQRDNEAMDQSFDNFIAKANALPWQ